MDNIDLQFPSGFLNLPDISSIVLIFSGSGEVVGKVDVKVVNHVRKKFQFYKRKLEGLLRDENNRTNVTDL